MTNQSAEFQPIRRRHSAGRSRSFYFPYIDLLNLTDCICSASLRNESILSHSKVFPFVLLHRQFWQFVSLEAYSSLITTFNKIMAHTRMEYPREESHSSRLLPQGLFQNPGKKLREKGPYRDLHIVRWNNRISCFEERNPWTALAREVRRSRQYSSWQNISDRPLGIPLLPWIYGESPLSQLQGQPVPNRHT